MATTPELLEPQIAAARAQAWRQASDTTPEGQTGPLLTLEAARDFINEHGLVLFAPRPLGAPAPSLVEATLGTAKSAATPADTETARTLVARLVGEGSALPLNLLGGPGELPDFVVSTSAFPFVFTLRGDKGWKRPPETSGAVKVTPLALRVYELLTERGALTVAEIVTEVGREVTDSAISRALNELWSLLRVLPVLQQGEGDTRWELVTARFQKAVKAGANAGQPTALSALVSLYLGQAFIATEEEVASFLSPLTARSRVREVLHGLIAGRQLGEAVLEGKTVVYIPDALPDFAQFAEAEDTVEAVSPAVDDDAGSEAAPDAPGEGEGRIRRFEAGADGGSRPKPLRGKPAAREGGFRSGPRTAPRPGARPTGDRPRPGTRGPRSAEGGASRPPRSRDGEAPQRRPAGDRPTFNRPWDEERASRPPRDAADVSSGERPARAPRAEGGRPPRREGIEGRPYRPARPRDDSRPPRREGDRPPFRREGGERPPFRREGSGGERPFSPRREGPGSDRPERRSFAPGGDRPRTNRPPSDRPYVRREGSSGDRPAPPREEGRSGFERGNFDRPRPDRGSSDRSSFNRGSSGRPSFDRPRPGAGPRSEGRPGRAPGQGFSRGPGSRPPFRAGSGEGRPAGDRPNRGEGAGRPPKPFSPRSGPSGAGDRGGFARGPKREFPDKRGPRGGSPSGPSRGRPATRKRPEDEA